MQPLLCVRRDRAPGGGVLEEEQVSGKRDPVSAEGQSETGAQLQSQPVSPVPKHPPKLPKTRKPQPTQTLTCQSDTKCQAPLVGKRSQLKCSINGHPATVLFDTGSQVSIIDRAWASTHIPSYPVRSLQELLETDLEVYAANGQPIPYDGWVELTVNLTGNDYPDLTVQTPFLVSQLSLSQPLLGANVLEQVIKRQESSGAAVATLLGLLRRAFGMEEEQVTAMVNYIQVPQKPFCDPATVRVGRDNTVIPAGKAVHVWCRVPLNFDTSDSLVLYEPAEEHPILGQLSVGAGLLEINHTQRPHIRVPISNHSKHEITLPKRTPLGVIQHVTKVLDTAESPRADTLTAVTAEVNHTASPSTGNRPTRTLHRNLLLQVNDLPVEPPPSSVTNPRESHKRTKRHSEPLKLTERTQSPDTSDSEEEDGVYRYWLRLPARTDRNSPGPDVIQEPQENIGQDQIQQEQRVDVESEQERESVIEEEQEVHSEAERDMDQLQPSDDQQPPEVVCLEEDIAGPLQPEHPAPLRHSSRVRRPGYMFTYPSLGQPAYLPRPTVNAVGIHPMQWPQLCYPQPYPLPFQPPMSPSITPYSFPHTTYPFPHTTYPIQCF
ncbi:hypothetical protein N1851_020463 [Merluccius polli]|uniref:Peptidase A2 domain-containing protein n=1 Tax=Merluccius polli TaxID=89951 RepID=A0AA47MKQ3_MERPO|nr:hypothetical protein N1851_020463 [Merluccius polli]